MAEAPEGTTGEVVCPHCRKTFEPGLLIGDPQRAQGFKCPHCRLFVASDRAEGATEPSPS
jgi:hypothetical protein